MMNQEAILNKCKIFWEDRKCPVYQTKSFKEFKTLLTVDEWETVYNYVNNVLEFSLNNKKYSLKLVTDHCGYIHGYLEDSKSPIYCAKHLYAELGELIYG